MKRTTSVEDHKLTAAYESVRATLSAARYADRRDKPLAFWALPGDRRLPMALLGDPLKALLSHSFDELAATAGIGKKKLYSLIKLLHRATKDHPPAVLPFTDEPAAKRKGAGGPKSEHAEFNPAVVSELLWEQWRETARRYGLQKESLGRLGPSLYRLPTVIWRTPLARYMKLTVTEIRRLKTHGEKRVQAILEVFHSVHETLGHVPHHLHLRVDVRPKFTVAIEQWINEVLRRSQPPTLSELKHRVVSPILEQLRIDAGPEVFRIVEERLGTKSAPHPVQQQAKRLGVTRARVYQLLETCGDVMSVRWPEGEELFGRLYQKLASFPTAKPQAAQLRALTELIYPELAYPIAVAKNRATQSGTKGRDAARSDVRRSRRDVSDNKYHKSKSNGSAPRWTASRGRPSRAS